MSWQRGQHESLESWRGRVSEGWTEFLGIPLPEAYSRRGMNRRLPNLAIADLAEMGELLDTLGIDVITEQKYAQEVAQAAQRGRQAAQQGVQLPQAVAAEIPTIIPPIQPAPREAGRWQRKEYEDVGLWRERVKKGWEQAEQAGFVPPPPEVRTRGRRVPLRTAELTQMSRVLDGLEEPSHAPPRPVSAKAEEEEQAAVAAEEEGCITTDWYDLFVEVEISDGAWATMDAGPPSREEMLAYFEPEDRGELMLVQFRTQGTNVTTVWQTWAGDPTMVIFDYKRFYMFWRSQRKNHWYDGLSVQFRFCRIPEDVVDASVFHGEENCAMQILTGLYKSKARELTKIKLEDDGAFRRAQAMAAAKVVKRNIELRNRLEGVIYATAREDGTPLYQGLDRHRKKVPPIVLYDYDGHAVPDKPARPDVSKLEVTAVEYSPDDYWTVTGQYGALAKLWPLGGEAAVVERWMDSPILIRAKTRYEAVKQRAEELNIGDYKLIGSPFGVEVEAWKRDNGFSRTPDMFRELWKSANFFPIPYSNLKVKPGKTSDLNSAYESCAMINGAAADLREQYGFPSDGGMIAFKNPPEAVLELTGLVVAILDLARCHPWVQYLARGQERGTYTTMRLKVWKDEGAAVITKLELAVLARKKTPSCRRPEGTRWTPPNAKNGQRYGIDLAVAPEGETDKQQAKRIDARRHWGRQAIGRLVPNPANASGFDYIYVRDQAEAGSLVHMLIANRALGSYEYVPKPQPPRESRMSEEELAREIEEVLAELQTASPAAPVEDAPHFDEVAGYHKIGVRHPEDARSACYHTHAYFLDYTSVVVDREIFRHSWDSIARVATDCITLAEGREFSPAVKIGTGVGEWKEAEHKKIEYDQFSARPDVPDYSSIPTADYWEPLHSDGMTIFEGPPGYGKTYHCLGKLKGVPHVVLTPTRKMRRAILRDSPAEGRQAYTWQWALKPGKKFDPYLVRVPRGAILYIPEIGTWDGVIAKEIITWLINEHDCRIIADGDRRQMAPPEGISPWSWLDTVSTNVPWMETDYRSKTLELASLKMELRKLRTNRQVFDRLKRVIAETHYVTFCDEWHPMDYVYCARIRTRERMTEDLRAIHRDKYPDVPLRIRYGEANKARCGEEEHIALGAPIPATAYPEYVSTYSSCQGETASADITGRLPRVWLVDHCVSEFFTNAVYVGATRVEQTEQLGIVTDPPLSKEELEKQARLFSQDEIMDLAELE